MMYAKQQIEKIIGEQVLTNSLIELKDNINVKHKTCLFLSSQICFLSSQPFKRKINVWNGIILK